MPDEKQQPASILDEPQLRPSTLLDEDFVDAPAPAPQPRQSQPSPQADQLALDIRAGMIQAGFDPEQMTPEGYAEFEHMVREQHTQMRGIKAAQEFLRRHATDYLPCPQNEQAMYEAANAAGFDGTDVRELEYAYNVLRSQGKLVGPQRSASLGLSDRQGTREPVASEPLDDESFRRELDKLPLDQARRFTEQHMRMRP